MDNALVIAARVLVMAVILAVGFAARKTGVITPEGTKQMSAVELKIVNPLLIFMSYQADFDATGLRGLLWSFALSAASFAVVIPLASFLRKKKGENYTVERFSAIYSNCGFMGIPLITALFGTKGVLYLTAYITCFNLLAFTHGYMLIKEERDFSAFVTALRSPTIIAVIVGAVCYVTNLRLTGIPFAGNILVRSFEFIADMNTPLAMLIAGATAAGSRLLKSFSDSDILITSALKLLVMPGVICLLTGLLPSFVPEMPRLIVCIATGCPAATTGTMFALLFGKNARRCSEIFAFTTIISIATLPLVTWFATFCNG